MIVEFLFSSVHSCDMFNARYFFVRKKNQMPFQAFQIILEVIFSSAHSLKPNTGLYEKEVNLGEITTNTIIEMSHWKKNDSLSQTYSNLILFKVSYTKLKIIPSHQRLDCKWQKLWNITKSLTALEFKMFLNRFLLLYDLINA